MGTADLAQLAERIHGKDEVAGSIPAISMMNRKKPNFNGLFCIGDDIKTSNSPAIIGDGIILGQSGWYRPSRFGLLSNNAGI